MKTSIRILALVGKFAGIVAGLGAYADALPPKYASIGILVFGISSVLKDSVNRLGDLLDDGKANDSFKT